MVGGSVAPPEDEREGGGVINGTGEQCKKGMMYDGKW